MINWRNHFSCGSFQKTRPAAWLGHLSLALLAMLLLPACRTKSDRPTAAQHTANYFAAWTNFSRWQSAREPDRTIYSSPRIPSPIEWDELIVSWNVHLGPNTYIEIEAAPISEGRTTTFYKMGRWTGQDSAVSRESVPDQRDDEAAVETDTLVLKRPAEAATIRVSVSGTPDRTALKFVGLSFFNSKAENGRVQPPNRAAWGKVIDVPEKSQLGYAGASGWCSPAAVSMVLSHWSKRLERTDLDRGVSEVAQGVYDRNWPGTGNWPFNTAYAGAFPAIRAYVTRFDDIREIEDWISAGIPVVISAPYHLLNNSPPSASTGHVVVCVGFTETGDVVINDPWTRLNLGQRVRRVYSRANVVNAWRTSHNTVYLIYPESAKVPANRFGHWAGVR